MTFRSILLAALMLTACPPVLMGSDAGVVLDAGGISPVVDAGALDASVLVPDASVPTPDASVPTPDASVPDASVLVPDASVPDASVVVEDAGTFSYSVIDAGTLFIDGKAFDYKLLRFNQPGKAPSYGQYFPPPDGGAGPIVVVTQPYAGAGWTGEEVDRRWQAKAPTYSLYPDTDSPGADGGDTIVYQPMSVEDGVSQSFIYLFHNVGVLQVFARFYAGGSIENDVDDVVGGFRFLEVEPTARKNEIGIFGGSWGGFEAVYGAMRAPESVRPKVGMAAYPLTDFEFQEHYLTHLGEKFSAPGQIAAVEAFFAPYRRRIAASTSGTQGFSRWNAAAVRAELRTPMNFLHDEFDVLVPIEETRAQADGGLVDAFILPHANPPQWDTYGLKHFPIEVEEPNNDSAVISFSVAHLMLNLTAAPQTVYVPIERVKLHAFIVQQHAAQKPDDPMHAFARQLLELAESRVYVFETPGFALAGPEYVTGEVNSVWGTSFTTATIRAQLALGLPSL